MKTSEWNFEHFKWNEFDSGDQANSGLKMSAEFMEKLERSRVSAGVSFKINSGYRTILHNEKVGGSKGSSHISGVACDISAKDSVKRFKLIQSLLSVGFNRIGIAKTFIHVDSDRDKSENVIWMY